MEDGVFRTIQTVKKDANKSFWEKKILFLLSLMYR